MATAGSRVMAICNQHGGTSLEAWAGRLAAWSRVGPHTPQSGGPGPRQRGPHLEPVRSADSQAPPQLLLTQNLRFNQLPR